ncbi:hypothetical protein KC367_g1203 [Hortaea werneckii]|uniref:NAD(P)-binding protein n=1 Tax=Hortaea werneckii EXF-2000 TaxID=1157616 RepID=A0A1Z5T7X5_HORWE|nr:hypothetical protein KC358_g2665 [Hortaea werneckii]OTA32135.1 hypothetical protein BTJ68_07871 [Hortaea werneckii EXF-2000]KAI6850139.1 hypothetical protein KC350_g2248 [Hortaea werneckii]KAI6940644.1 hypothetical protein KC341_g3375 [Hortaea werneckii]KAI6941798.1 hypothetical protein KC348_g4614 [Hortaea werneckii]
MPTDKLITLVTGSNQGIGYHAAAQIAASGQHYVLVGARDQIKGQRAVDALVSEGVRREYIEAIQIDVDSDASISTAAKDVEGKFGRLDVLILNAGIFTAPGSVRDQYAGVYNTNVFGAAATTEIFLPLLRKSTLPGGKKILFVSSGLSSLSMASAPDSVVPAHIHSVYRSSKTAENMVMAGFATLLKEEGFLVGAICPGFCATNLNGYEGPKKAEDGARAIVRAVTEEGLREAVHGKLWHQKEEVFGLVWEEGTYDW